MELRGAPFPLRLPLHRAVVLSAFVVERCDSIKLRSIFTYISDAQLT